MESVNRIEYLRVSLLTACNLNCRYCRPSGSGVPPTHSEADPAKLASAIALLCDLGVRKIRFTGGEPTLYTRLPETIGFAKRCASGNHTCLTTNGLLLARQAATLADSGIDSVNISLDTIQRGRFRAITGTDGLSNVLDGITAAQRYIASVKLNCVVMRDLNDDEVGELIAFAEGRGVDIRFIEYMPTSSRAHASHGYLPNETLISRLPYELSPIEQSGSSAARYYRSSDLRIRVGFISPVSRPFCQSCNRVRLTSDGKLYSCLFSEESLDLFNLLQSEPDLAREQICSLISTKRFSGCSDASVAGYCRPAFVVMGG